MIGQLAINFENIFFSSSLYINFDGKEKGVRFLDNEDQVEKKLLMVCFEKPVIALTKIAASPLPPSILFSSLRGQ